MFARFCTPIYKSTFLSFLKFIFHLTAYFMDLSCIHVTTFPKEEAAFWTGVLGKLMHVIILSHINVQFEGLGRVFQVPTPPEVRPQQACETQFSKCPDSACCATFVPAFLSPREGGKGSTLEPPRRAVCSAPWKFLGH